MSYDKRPQLPTEAVYSKEKQLFYIRKNNVIIKLWRGAEAVEKAKEILLNENFEI